MNLLEMRLRAVERSARVLRYHTEPVVHRQSVGEHTYGVLWMLCLITDPSKELMKAGLMHDTAEYVAGDVPSPAKRHVTIKEAFDKVEEEVLAQLAWRLPDLTDEEERLLKLADLHAPVDDIGRDCLAEEAALDGQRGRRDDHAVASV